jgi:hypothetical protein
VGAGGGSTTYGWGKFMVVDKGKGRQRWLAGKRKRARLKRGTGHRVSDTFWAKGYPLGSRVCSIRKFSRPQFLCGLYSDLSSAHGLSRSLFPVSKILAQLFSFCDAVWCRLVSIHKINLSCLPVASVFDPTDMVFRSQTLSPCSSVLCCLGCAHHF